MAEFSMPFDAVETSPNVYDREYNALQFAKYLGGLVETGIMKGALQELKLSNTGANMQTILATGIAYIAVNGAVHYYENDSPLTLTHDTESIGLNRIDRIVLRLDLNTNERQIKAVIKKGVAAASPVAPSLTQNNMVYEISIGQVLITGGQTFIAANAITQHVGTVTAWATSKILPNYDDATLMNHVDSVVIHTPYAVATGTANAKNVTIPFPITYLVDGMAVILKNNLVNTGSVTLNVNGLGAKPVVKSNGDTLIADDLVSNGIYTLRYNDTTGNFILQGDGGDVLKAPISGDTIKVLSIEGFSITGRKDTLTKFREIQILKSGRITVNLTIRNSTNIVVQGVVIYKNGVAQSTEYQSPSSSGLTTKVTYAMSVVAGDLVQIYARAYNNNIGTNNIFTVSDIYISVGNQIDFKVAKKIM